MLSEFEIIDRFFNRPAPSAVLGVGDDAALLKISPGMELAVSTDMMVAGRHFFPDTDPYKLGRKLLAVNLSDMAAMGARPRWVTLSLALPESNEKWIEAFAGGFLELASEYQVELIGGDTTRGPLTLCVQIMGEVPDGQALRRDGARAGDGIWVSGRLGDAALALAHRNHRIHLEPHEMAACLPALHTPVPRVALGERLRGIAHSAIDISDGLLADLGHIATSSRVSASIELEKIPASDALRKHFNDPVARACLVAGGDDYELCFTAAEAARSALETIARELGVPLTCIGCIEAGEGVVLKDRAGHPVSMGSSGFDHFRNGT